MMKACSHRIWACCLLGILAPTAQAQNRPPPPQAFTDCRGHAAGDSVQHRTREGIVNAECAPSPEGLFARPRASNAPASAAQQAPAPYSLEQALSDQAQLSTIAFNGLAFLTGSFGEDTFLPPGKVSDYFGFQYLRDIDAVGAGHQTAFLTKIAFNMLSILDARQIAELVSLAQSQGADIRRFAELRFPLIKAFRMHLEGKPPAGTQGLDLAAVMQFSANLYALDGQLAYERARVMAKVLRSLTESQKAALAQLKFGNSSTWPTVAEPAIRRELTHEVDVAVMTYASEMFSWSAGSLESDTYFCPERHGMYFGGFGMKTAPAMGKPNYAISTSLTSQSGEQLMATLTETQRAWMSAIPKQQRESLQEIVRVRRQIAAELRRFLKGEVADPGKVKVLSKRYGELDGKLSYLYATTFAKIGQTLTPAQRSRLQSLRSNSPSDPKGPFLYSTPIQAPQTDQASSFFR